MNAYIKSLENWAKTWRMAFAPHKTAFTIFNTKTDFSLINSIYLQMGDQKVKYEKHPKFLGIVFDPNLNFEEHSRKIREKAFDRISVLKIISHPTWKLGKSTLIRVYKTLIRSLMDYSAPLYNCFSPRKLSDTSKYLLQDNPKQKIRLKNREANEHGRSAFSCE